MTKCYMISTIALLKPVRFIFYLMQFIYLYNIIDYIIIIQWYHRHFCCFYLCQLNLYVSPWKSKYHHLLPPQVRFTRFRSFKSKYFGTIVLSQVRIIVPYWWIKNAGLFWKLGQSKVRKHTNFYVLP